MLTLPYSLDCTLQTETRDIDKKEVAHLANRVADDRALQDAALGSLEEREAANVDWLESAPVVGSRLLALLNAAARVDDQTLSSSRGRALPLDVRYYVSSHLVVLCDLQTRKPRFAPPPWQHFLLQLLHRCAAADGVGRGVEKCDSDWRGDVGQLLARDHESRLGWCLGGGRAEPFERAFRLPNLFACLAVPLLAPLARATLVLCQQGDVVG